MKTYFSNVKSSSSFGSISRDFAICTNVQSVGFTLPVSIRAIWDKDNSDLYASSSCEIPLSALNCLSRCPKANNTFSSLKFNSDAEDDKKTKKYYSINAIMHIFAFVLGINRPKTLFVSMLKLKYYILPLTMLWGFTAHAQIQILWETNHPVGNDSLEIMFHKQDSAGNHYMGGGLGSNYFLSKFDATGVHQWTKSGNLNLNSFPEYPFFDTQTVIKSWFSDLVITDSILFLAGTKQYPQPQSLNKNSFNFILKLNSNGDSLGFRNVVKDDIPLSNLSGEPAGYKPILHVLENQVYYFTSMLSGMGIFGHINVTVFKYDEPLNRLKYQVFDGIRSASRDTIKDVQFFDDKFIIHSMDTYWPRLLACDTSLNLLWHNYFRAFPTSNHTTIGFNIHNSQVYIYPTTIDTSRNNPPLYYFRFYGHVRAYDVSSGQFVDSTTIFQTLSSNDNVTDALVYNGDNVITGVSEDNGLKRVFLKKLDEELNLVKNTLLGENPIGRVQLESDGCRFYLSFIDSLSTGTVLKIFRLDENLNILSEETYYKGKDKISSLIVKDKQIKLLSIGKNNQSDTLSLKSLSDTIKIAEPVTFTSTATAPRSIELSWHLSSGLIDTIFINKSTDNISWQLLSILPSSETTFTDSNLTPSTKYYYSIRTKWNNEYSCNEIFASDSTPFNTSVNFMENQYFRLYPNPASESIFIDGDDFIEELELLTISGQIIINQAGNKKKVNISDIPSGLYLLRINKTHTYKILKL